MEEIETDDNLSRQILIFAGIFAILSTTTEGGFSVFFAITGLVMISASLAVTADGHNRRVWEWLAEVLD